MAHLDAHLGPKCMLINGLAGSGGDYFPWWFREAGLGKLIGTRTWGGLVGIGWNTSRSSTAGRPSLRSSRSTRRTVPGASKVNGVDPDIEVVDDPALMGRWSRSAARRGDHPHASNSSNRAPTSPRLHLTSRIAPAWGSSRRISSTRSNPV